MSLHRTAPTPSHADHLADRIREMMEVQAMQILRSAGAEQRVRGIGVGWRSGDLALIVQPTAYEDVPFLRAHLPDRVNDFAVSIEMEEPLDVVSAGNEPACPPHRRSSGVTGWLRRLFSRRDRLAECAVTLPH